MKHPESERGYLGPSMALFMLALILLAGMAIDLSGQMRTMQRADAVAREAGRQGAQAVDVSQAMAGNAQVVDPGMAKAAAQRYLSSAGVSGDVTIRPGNQLDVTTTTAYKPLLLGMIGIDQMTCKGHAQVQLVRVVNGQER